MTIEGPPNPEQEASHEHSTSERVALRAAELAPQMIKTYEDLHRHPEIGGQEVETAARIRTELERLGIEIVKEKIGNPAFGFKGTGIIARIRGKEDGPTVALRADIDALPITESKDHEVRSENEGVSHACGHDAHTAGLLGAAELLKEYAERGELPGDVILLFQPSEESAVQKESGAVQMIQALERLGLRDEIKAFFGQHVYRSSERGKINVKEGVLNASSGDFKIMLSGEGGHIMNAYEQPNLNSIFSEVTMRLEEYFRPLSQEGRAHVASSGPKLEGHSGNVLAAAGEAIWVVRIPHETYKEDREVFAEKIKQVVAEVVKNHDPKQKINVSYKMRYGYRPVISRDKELVAIAEEAAKKIIPNCENESKTLMGGEDFAFYGEKLNNKTIPSVFMMVGAANPSKGIPVGAHHTTDFRIDPDVIKDLAAIHTKFALSALEKLSQKNEARN